MKMGINTIYNSKDLIEFIRKEGKVAFTIIF